jgi:RHS repeat-associated protein
MNRDHGAKSRYTYDYLGRRIRKTATGYAAQRYLYDGWNLIAELDDSGTITRQFVWGLDVSGSAQGAGGVGGLLEIDAGGTSQYYPIYDASHNVIGLYSGTGAIAAAYEYDPFGNKQTGLGTYAAANPFRFSTKYTDPDSGLVYYGMRYYSAKLGRFLNQDPIEEAGGINLYAFCGNDGVNRFDLLGMDGLTFVEGTEVFWGGVAPSITVYPQDDNSSTLWAPGQVDDPTGQYFKEQMNSSQRDQSTMSITNVPFAGQPNVQGNGVTIVLAPGRATLVVSNPKALAAFWAKYVIPNSALSGSRPEIVTEDMLIKTYGPEGTVWGTDPWTGKTVVLYGRNLGMSDATLDIAGLVLDIPILKSTFSLIGGAFGRLFGRAERTAIAAADDVFVLGRQVDTAVAKQWPGHNILDIPNWTLKKNDAFIQGIIDSRGKVYLGSPQTRATLWDAANNRATVFARELDQLRAAGYREVGDYMLPPVH